MGLHFNGYNLSKEIRGTIYLSQDYGWFDHAEVGKFFKSEIIIIGLVKMSGSVGKLLTASGGLFA